MNTRSVRRPSHGKQGDPLPPDTRNKKPRPNLPKILVVMRAIVLAIRKMKTMQRHPGVRGRKE